MGKLILKYGNILDYIDSADVIVNSTNKHMISGSGVCGAIYRKANKEKLEGYCRNHFDKPMKVNEVRITKGFDLGIDIIHIYCPKAYESKEPLKELLKSYENIFKIAKEKAYENIVCPSLGTGIHGYKEKEVIEEVLKKLEILVKNYKINFNLIIFKKEKTDGKNNF